MSPRAGVTHHITIETVGGTNRYGFMVPRKGPFRPWDIFLAPTIAPRVLTTGDLTRAEFPPDIAQQFFQDNWQGGIGGINYRTHPLMLQDAVMIDTSGNAQTLRLPPRVTQSNVDAGETAPAQLVPCGFAQMGNQMWAFEGRRPYRWDFAAAAWDARTIPFDSASHIRNGVAFAGNWYAPRWADDVGSGGSYTADDEPSIYIYKNATDAQWTNSTLGNVATVPDAFKYFAVADGLLWGGNTMSIADSTLDLTSGFDATSSGSADNVTSLTVSHTMTTQTNRLLLVWTAARDAAGDQASGVTYAGTAMTQVATVGPFNNIRVALWRLTAPATGANNIIATWPDAQADVSLHAMSFSDVDQTTPLGTAATATGTSATPSVDVTSVAGDRVVDGAVNEGTGTAGTPGANQTERIDVNANFRLLASTEEATGATTTMSWTAGNNNWATIAVALKRASLNSSATVFGTTGTPSNQFVAGDVIRVDNEYMLVTAVTDAPAQLTVVRGYRGSAAAAHTGALNIYEVTRRANRIHSSSDGTNTGTWAGQTDIGDTSAPITALLGRVEDLVVCKTDGLYRVESDGTITELDVSLRSIAHPDNFRGAVLVGNKGILPLGAGGLLELDFETFRIRDISPRLMLPNLSAYTGRCIPIAGDPNIFFCLVLESGNTRYHLFKVEWLEIDGVSEWRWHHFYRASYTTGTDQDHAAGLAVGMQGDNDAIHHRLWFGIESTGATLTTSTSAMPYFMPIDSTDANDLVSNDATNPSALTTVYDKNLPNIPSRLQAIRFRTSNLGSGANQHTIEVQYRVDGGAFAYVTGGQAGSTLNTSPQTLTFAAQITGRIVELQILPKFGSSGTGNPSILEFTLTSQLRADTVELIPVRTILQDGEMLLNGPLDSRVQARLSQLKTWRDQAAEVTVVAGDTPFGVTTYTCVFLPNHFRWNEISRVRGRRPGYLVEFLLANVG